ncbi:MAG: protein jag [Syntrophales bacterium]|jgi:spoIIIJ-associated protein|nr:protein jag [Syntrophales bacterium]MDY0044781.1 RNA-binding cell elongation regulator Jag/EloR [Syntrophales bacterium]
MKDFMEIEAKTIDEAIEKACREYALPREKLNIEIISEGSGGFLGILSKRAKIRASVLSIDMDISGPFHEMPRSVSKDIPVETQDVNDIDIDMAETSRKMIEGILSRMGFPFPVSIKESDEYILLNIKGDGSGILIGKGGQTLDALQYIVNKALNKNGKERKRIILDTENYREKREKSLVTLARKLGEKAKRIKKPVTVNPMNAHDRRIIHLALQNDKELVTKSKGEGAFRKIIIVPNKKG